MTHTPGTWRCRLPRCGMTGDGGWEALRHHLMGSHYRPDARGIWGTR